jgi:AAA+ ATPase superfamily predicted ATPase
MNPFPINYYVSPSYFCDRKAEAERLIRNIENGFNTALLSIRSLGKTGLINHVFLFGKKEEV